MPTIEPHVACSSMRSVDQLELFVPSHALCGGRGGLVGGREKEGSVAAAFNATQVACHFQETSEGVVLRGV